MFVNFFRFENNKRNKNAEKKIVKKKIQQT